MRARPLAVELGEFVHGLSFEALPAAVVDKAKALINHAMTVAMACHGAPRPIAAREAVIAQERIGNTLVGAGQGATLWVTGTRVTRAGAAFANGVAIAVNNQCDSYHMLTHPGVLPDMTTVMLSPTTSHHTRMYPASMSAARAGTCTCGFLRVWGICACGQPAHGGCLKNGLEMA